MFTLLDLFIILAGLALITAIVARSLPVLALAIALGLVLFLAGCQSRPQVRRAVAVNGRAARVMPDASWDPGYGSTEHAVWMRKHVYRWSPERDTLYSDGKIIKPISP